MNRLLEVAPILAITCGLALAGEAPSPPYSYSLSDVTFEYRQGGGLIAGSRTIAISGTGEGTRIENSGPKERVTTHFAVDAKDVFGLLQRCYKWHFFDLRDDYVSSDFPQLGADGRIQVMSSSVADASGESITLRIGGYAKKVGYIQWIGNPPGILEEVRSKIEEIEAHGAAK